MMIMTSVSCICLTLASAYTGEASFRLQEIKAFFLENGVTKGPRGVEIFVLATRGN
jgi:hypothetical protein